MKKQTLKKKIRHHKKRLRKHLTRHTVRLKKHLRKHGRKHAFGLAVLVMIVATTMLLIGQKSKAAGIDDVTVTLSNEATSATAQITVTFTFGTLSNGNTIVLYIGETTGGGNNFGLNGVTTADIACSDNGAGESYTVNSVDAASATAPLRTQITATTVGGGATAVTCTIGDNSPNPTNPATAGNYSVAVVTTNDSGAGIAYVGNANDVTTSATALPNLTITINNADGTACATTLGVTACNLGTVTTANVNTGNYDVNVGTNAANGASMRLAEDGNLRNGADDINDIGENTTVTAGVEGYGVAVSADAAWAEQGDFTDDDTPITSGPTTVATTGTPIDLTGDDVTITHRVAVSSSVKALTFSHIVTWTASPNF